MHYCSFNLQNVTVVLSLNVPLEVLLMSLIALPVVRTLQSSANQVNFVANKLSL